MEATLDVAYDRLHAWLKRETERPTMRTNDLGNGVNIRDTDSPEELVRKVGRDLEAELLEEMGPSGMMVAQTINRLVEAHVRRALERRPHRD